MLPTRPFRFGVVTAQATSSQQWIAKARRAETLGYSTFLMPDFIGPGLSPFPALAFAAAATRTIRIGTFVLANEFHSPVFVALSRATLDFLSEGRFELGLGAGRSAESTEYRKVGLGVSPRDGETVLREKIEVVRRAAGSRFDSLELSTNLIAVAGHAASEAVVRPRLRYMFRVELDQLVSDRSPFVVSGTVDDMVDQIRDRRDRFGITYITSSDDLMEAFDPVVGSVRTIAEIDRR